jgi:hypothetical protein
MDFARRFARPWNDEEEVSAFSADAVMGLGRVSDKETIIDNRLRCGYSCSNSLDRGTHSGCDPKCGASAVAPRELAIRAGAASGIRGQERAGNARWPLSSHELFGKPVSTFRIMRCPRPREHGLELSGASPREPRSKRRKAGAPPIMARSRAADE